MNLTQMITGFATPMIASKLAGALGLPEGVVRKIVSVGIPVVLAAIMKRGSAPGGTDALGGALSRMGDNPLDALGAALGGDASQVKTASSAGGDLLSSILGADSAGTLASKLGSYGGVDAKAAAPLLGTIGSMALGGLKKTADDQGLDAAGVMKLLESEKGDIAKAIPADFAKMLQGTDLVGANFLQSAASAPAAPKPAPPRPAPPPPAPRKGGMSRWIIGLIVLALLVWLVSKFLGGPPEEPAPVEPAATEEPAPATTTEAAPAEPAAEPAETTAAEVPAADAPEVGEGIDVTADMQQVLDRITGALTGITDQASAEAAAPALAEADAALEGMTATVEALPAEARTSLQSAIAAALPAIEGAAEKLTSDATIGPIVKPAIDGILAKLRAYAG
ncbi:MAG TPA: DUF937 domain-containing protein [Amaricoccus sp.]|uniref:DUF937 domain-containing protein n=3 Tax=Amaricoccus sp. TaxID=1872485 RepID=UPI002BBBD013|nr:DUF937 domain-containing protein [Amaricoccus sp.]HMR53370.1 DUF937 domain-containing protein [Amaricoccus sp.]HMR59787.1 DUF937 domain-containing protein [Amaricoccus sp.]HMU00314.1 DUF937 domain-containing protein [Amaricoccus sp.]